MISTIAVYAYYKLAPNGGTAISSVAVLPFQNASGDPDVEYCRTASARR